MKNYKVTISAEPLREYVSELNVSCGSATIKTYVNAIYKFITPSGGEVSRSAVLDAVATMQKQNMSAKTIKFNLKRFVCFCRFAVRRGYVPAELLNELEDIRLPRGYSKPIQLPDIDTAKELYRLENFEPENASYKDLRAVFLSELILTTGMRAFEISALEFNDIDEENSIIIVRSGKGGKPRSVILHDAAKKLLNAWKKRTSGKCVFPTLADENKPISATRVSSIFREFTSRKINMGLSAHKGRHIFASLQAEANIPITSIQESLGHNSAQTTALYLQSLRSGQSAKDAQAAAFGL